MSYRWVTVTDPAPQPDSLGYAPPHEWGVSYVTPPIPYPVGYSPLLHAPAAPQAIPGGYHLFLQANGHDILIADVQQAMQVSRMSAPPVPTVGGGLC